MMTDKDIENEEYDYEYSKWLTEDVKKIFGAELTGGESI